MDQKSQGNKNGGKVEEDIEKEREILNRYKKRKKEDMKRNKAKTTC